MAEARESAQEPEEGKDGKVRAAKESGAERRRTKEGVEDYWIRKEGEVNVND